MAINKLLSFLNQKKNSGDKNLKSWIKTTTGYSPINLALYQKAFSHSSFSGSKNGVPVSNERLEFLGDAILGAIIADYIFKMYPIKDEGFLTQLRSKIVNGQSLKELALKFGFDYFLKTGLTKEDKIKSSAYGDAFEAFIGAIYLDQGYAKTKQFVITRIVKTHLNIEELVSTDLDFKSQLQIYCQKNKLNLEYKLISEEKQGAHKIFVIQAVVNEKPYVKFENFSKRFAEQKAAELTLELLKKELG